MVTGPFIAQAVFAASATALENGRWRPGFHDPSVMDWATTGLYVVAFLWCSQAAFRIRPTDIAPLDLTRMKLFWAMLSVMMLLLAVNKQMDLHQWAWLTARAHAREHSWYDKRHYVQIGAMVSVVLFAVASGAAMIRLVRRTAPRGTFGFHVLALVGALLTASYVVIRMASLSRVDKMIGWNVGSVTLNRILENVGIVVVIVGSQLAIQASRRHGHGG